MKIRNLAAVLGLTGGFLLAGQAQALYLDERPNGGGKIEIDDWVITGSSSTSDSTTGDGAAPTANRGTGGSGYWVDGGMRDGELYVNLLSGDNATTEDCGNCQVGHTTNRASSTAHHYFTLEAPDPSLILMGDSGDKIGFNYETDIAGADYFVTFSNNGQKVGDTLQWMDVAATGLSIPPPRPLCCNLEGTLTMDFQFDDIRIDVFSNGGTYTDPTSWLGTVALGNAAVGLDTNIGDVPAPGTLALLSLGMIGFGWQRRRARA